MTVETRTIEMYKKNKQMWRAKSLRTFCLNVLKRFELRNKGHLESPKEKSIQAKIKKKYKKKKQSY